MQFSRGQLESRREFFRAGARYGALALLSALAYLRIRRGRMAGQDCVNRGICSSCGIFASCGLPPALSAKRVRERT